MCTECNGCDVTNCACTCHAQVLMQPAETLESIPKSAWIAAANLQAFLKDRGGIDDNAVIACAFHTYAQLANK